MSRIGTNVCFVFVVACTPVQEAGQPDGQACEQSTDCPADQVCSLETLTCVEPPAPELRVEVVPTSIADERGDEVSFTTGVPVHTHAGEPIALDANGCPAVFKYSYLLDPEGPPFGGETGPNPLAWRFSATGTITKAEYRVRTETATKLDWTPAAVDEDGAFTVTLHRSGARGIPELQAIAQQYFVDFRVSDELEHESTATACWDHHPLAVPVAFTGLSSAVDADALRNFTLLANSPVSRLINSSPGVKTFAGRISHSTAEAVTVQFAVPVPAASFSKTVVTDLLPEARTESVGCGMTCAPNSNTCLPEPAEDPRCLTSTPSDPADSTVTGAVTRGFWEVNVIDAQTGQTSSECTIDGRTVTCVLPARSPQSPSKDLIVQVFGSELDELRPASGTLGELTFQGSTYTGLPVTEAKFRCESFTTLPTTEFGERFRFCTRFTMFSKLVALDQVRVDFAGPAVTMKTAIPANGAFPGTELAPPPHLPNGTVNGTGFVWDSGNDDLPGIQH